MTYIEHESNLLIAFPKDMIILHWHFLSANNNSFSDERKLADLWKAVHDGDLRLVKLIFPRVTINLEAKDENGDTLMQMMRQRQELECDGHWYHGMEDYLMEKGAKIGSIARKD